MRPRRRPAAVLAVALLAAAGLALAVAAAPEGPPLTNVDIVRMVMRGAHEADILEAIAMHPPLYDLSPEVVEELGKAGVSDRVIAAMKRRQAASGGAAASPAPTAAAVPGAAAETPAPRGTLAIEFEKPVDPQHPSETTAVALKTMPKGMERMPGQEIGLMSDMGLAILCMTADHVPDNWDTRSPLIGAPRHELLLLRPGSGVDKRKGFEMLYLDHADRYDVSLAEGRHAIVVAAAGREAGPGTWRVLYSDTARVDVVAGKTAHLTVRASSRLRGSPMTGYGLDVTWKILNAADGTPPPADAAGSPEPPA